jgi:hypothetical protein
MVTVAAVAAANLQQHCYVKKHVRDRQNRERAPISLSCCKKGRSFPGAIRTETWGVLFCWIAQPLAVERTTFGFTGGRRVSRP